MPAGRQDAHSVAQVAAEFGVAWGTAMAAVVEYGISVASLDPFRDYATALRTSLPPATRVLDAFHVTRLGFAPVDDVRRRVQQDDLGHRGRKDDPLYRIQRVLRRGHENLSDLAWDRLLTGLDVGDVVWQVAAAWIGSPPKTCA